MDGVESKSIRFVLPAFADELDLDNRQQPPPVFGVSCFRTTRTGVHDKVTPRAVFTLQFDLQGRLAE
jgi:hypothetical protein